MAYLKLTDAGAHSAGLNTTHQIVSATPEFVLTTPLEFTVSGGTAASPQLQHAQAGLIGVGTELWLKHTGDDTLTKVTVGGVSENSVAGDPAAETLTAGMLSQSGCTGFVADTLVDDNPATSTWFQFASGATVTIDLGTAKELTAWAWRMSGSHADNGSWVIEYSDTGSSWTSVGGSNLSCVGTGTTSDVQWCEKTWTGAGSHRYWRARAAAASTAATQYYLDVRVKSATSTTTYTLSDLSPAQSALPEKAFKIRSDSSKALMTLAAGATDEPLVKETALTLDGATTASQVVTTGASSLLPYFASGNLNDEIVITVDGVDYVVQPNGEVTETGSGPYTTTIPIPAQASAPTAAKLRSRFQTPVDINTVTYAAGPELTVAGAETGLADNPALKRLALKLRSDVTATTQRARAAKIYTKEMPA